MKDFIAFLHPDPDPLMIELMNPVVDDGSVPLLVGEIGRIDSDFKFVTTDVLPHDYPRMPKKKAQWKRERSGRR